MLEDGTPFPTLWWLTCRKLVSAIGELEASGWMKDINRLLEEDPFLREELRRAIENYIAIRDALVQLGKSAHPGGGPGRVKCLHAHAAHQLVTGTNPVGRAVLEELDWVDPQTRCV